MKLNDDIGHLIGILNEFMKNDGILAISIFDRDGNSMAHAARDDIEGDALSTTGGGLLSMSIKLMKSLNMDSMERTIIETGKGTIMLEHLQNGLGILLVASPGIPVGRIRLIMLNLVRKIQKGPPPIKLLLP